ncbi:hypothetical protein [Aestuariivita sp.]|uniref:hypothetical protein n=1 Tax=Aestuariivita sp. TaxID=1872407 RepID=UPI00216E8E9C|nr:hypothetical protein [Aestuariivita sp.]MCE8006197.1 hypothetical protein [Aestuariivita sp.]
MDFLSLPDWVPFQPDRPAISDLQTNTMDGLAGYTFIAGVFSDAEQALDGSGGLLFKPPEIEMIRVCRNLRIPQSDNPADLLSDLKEKVAPCLNITPVTMEGGGVRYEISPTQSAEVTRVERANKGGTEVVPQFFCFCEGRVVEKFLSDGNGSKWP